MSKKLPPGKPVQVPFTSHIKFEWFREFTFKERIAILFGSNLVVMSSVVTRHNPGEFQPFLTGKVSPEKSADEHTKRLHDTLLQDKAEKSLFGKVLKEPK